MCLGCRACSSGKRVYRKTSRGNTRPGTKRIYAPYVSLPRHREGPLSCSTAMQSCNRSSTTSCGGSPWRDERQQAEPPLDGYSGAEINPKEFAKLRFLAKYPE